MTTIVIAASRPWSLRYAREFQKKYQEFFLTHIIEKKDSLTMEAVKSLNPQFIFFPHWSWYIPKEIYDSYTCIVFHPSDVPFGRGGSPIQNLITLGYTETVVSAIRVVKEIDAGEVFLKRKVSLLGGGEEIFLRLSAVIFDDMIPHIVSRKPFPTPQEGEVVHFRRRLPMMSELNPEMTISQIYDYIRMLDIKGYPNAFLRFGDYTLTFSRPKLETHGVVADVLIQKEADHDKRG